MIEKDSALKALSNIMDPDLGQDIVTLGFIKNLEISGSELRFDLELTTPACPIKEQLKQQCVDELTKIGATKVDVTLSARPAQTTQKPGQENLAGIKSIIAVSSCKGGVGKSTVATNLAITLQLQGAKVGLLDADIYGPSQPTMFGVANDRPHVIDQTFLPLEVCGIKMMSAGFLFPQSEAAVLRGPMVSNVLQQILFLTRWGELDYLVLDMPPGTGDIQLTITQALALSGALIVTTPQKISLIDVAKGIAMFSKVNVPILGIVENMSYFICDQCDHKHQLYGQSGTPQLAETYGLDLLGHLPFSQQMVQGGDFGQPPSADITSPAYQAYSELSQSVVRQVAKVQHGSNSIPNVDIKW